MEAGDFFLPWTQLFMEAGEEWTRLFTDRGAQRGGPSKSKVKKENVLLRLIYGTIVPGPSLHTSPTDMPPSPKNSFFKLGLVQRKTAETTAAELEAASRRPARKGAPRPRGANRNQWHASKCEHVDIAEMRTLYASNFFLCARRLF